MINQNPKNILFRYAGANSKSLDCNYIDYSIDLLGDVEEMLDTDRTLIENYGAVRLLIEIELVVFYADTEWMKNFITAKDKVIIVDGHAFEIANDFKGFKFPLWHGSNIASEMKLKFQRKITGLPAWRYSAGGQTGA